MTHCRRIMLEELQRRNFSPPTIRSYLWAVERFARHFKCRPDRLNHTHLRSYQAHLLRTGQLQPKTVRLHASALRFFFVKTLKRRYLLDDTLCPKAPQRLPSILSVEEMARLIDAAWLFPGMVHNWRADKPITKRVLWDAVANAAKRADVRTPVSSM